jgi:cytochrome P450
MDNKTHARYAGLFSKALALPVLNDAVSTMQSACLMTMSNMANACKTSGSLGVSPRTFCEQFSYDASVRVLFGINPGTELYDELKSTFKMLNALDVSKKINKDMEKVLDRLRHFVQDHFKSLNSDPDSSVTCTLTELHRLDPSMPDAVCVDNLLFILKIASENVASLLLWLFKMLGENPEWMRRITEAEGGDGQGSQGAVIDRVVNETLRLAQSEYLYRRLLDDVQFDGMRLPKGWQLRLCVWESHRSAESFKHPNDFNPDRFLQRKIGVSEFSPFGYGAHGCNGVAMTSMICRVLLECLAGKFDWSVTEDGRIERKFLHWHHWQPSSSMRVQIEAHNGQQ